MLFWFSNWYFYIKDNKAQIFKIFFALHFFYFISYLYYYLTILRWMTLYFLYGIFFCHVVIIIIVVFFENKAYYMMGGNEYSRVGELYFL